ncbi:hypothetical protein H7J70_13660 [Mycolicibacterium celeriflavum]|uniref:Uncharacterized protein n=2 Tax=Mycolicibacterium celeriflavum TaxID=1249101 RepID=A0A1X0C042_MYCCF|nr:hypothetical protein [Mycolicibacterium celeriflavum]ORA50343.1 hypothetical protein BST21_03595 [Mycolicibacterium celeriflavum]BBY45379.1 hypothetical protein MCEL_36740 [Mycolicibacterium celeriflavum]
MSWLLVALIPGLLMVATFGLQRLEAGLHRDTVSATDVAKFLAEAEPSDVDTLARDGMSRALDGLRQRRHVDHAMAGGSRPIYHDSGLPTHGFPEPRVNPEFRPTRHADRV